MVTHSFAMLTPSSPTKLSGGAMTFLRVMTLNNFNTIRKTDIAYFPTSCTIVRDAEPPIFVSDHYPVVTQCC